MTLFVSNPSRQHVEFHYRTRITQGTDHPQVISIPSGGQVEMGHGWSWEETQYVITQIERAGGASADVAKGMERFTGLLWRQDKVVQVEEIEVANVRVEEALNQRSVEQATRSAASFDRVVNNNRGQHKSRLAKETSVEIVQDVPMGGHRTGDEVKFSLTVDPTAPRDARVPGL